MSQINQPLKLILHGLDLRFVKTMMLFLQGPCQGVAAIVTDMEHADIDLFDVDSISSKKLLTEHLQCPLTRPVITLSLQQYEEPRTYILKKPIKVVELKQILDSTKKFTPERQISSLNQNDADPCPCSNDDLDLFNNELFELMAASAWGNSPTPSMPAVTMPRFETPNYPDKTVDDDAEVMVDEVKQSTVSSQHTRTGDIPQAEAPELDERQEDVQNIALDLKTFLLKEEMNKTAKHATAIRLDERGYREVVGVIEEIDFSNPQQIANAFYNPKDFFQGCFQAAWVVARMRNQPLLLQSPYCSISIFPRTQEVWLEAGDTEISAFAGLKLKHKNISAEINLKLIDPKVVELKNALDKFHSAEAFLWKLACWTSKGRYPQELSFSQPMFLKSWPNFTRLMITPHALRISALLIRGPRTMDDIAKNLGINIQYVFVFISAANAVGLACQARRLTDTLIEPPKVEVTQKQGLLSRIMSKLRK